MALWANIKNQQTTSSWQKTRYGALPAS